MCLFDWNLRLQLFLLWGCDVLDSMILFSFIVLSDWSSSDHAVFTYLLNIWYSRSFCLSPNDPISLCLGESRVQCELFHSRKPL